MSTTREYLSFILEQLSSLPEITCRQMMGEYIVYNGGRIAAYICDNRLLVKPVPAASALMPNAHEEPPYPGAKPMLLVENVDNRAFMEELFTAIFPELPEPKPKKPRKSRV